MKQMLIAAALLTLAGSVQAQPHQTGALEVIRPWSRPAPAGGTGVGFMTLANRGKVADTLVAVESPLARRVEVHRSMDSGGMASMQRQPGLSLAPGGAITLAPGGYHLMFMGLTRALKVGDAVPATLVFASGARLKADFRVETGVAAPAMDHAHH